SGQPQPARGEIQLVRAGQADRDDIESLVTHTTTERSRQRRRRLTHVVTNGHCRGLTDDQTSERRAESLDPLFGELRSDHATNVIGLDDLGQVHRIGQERSPHSTSLVIAAYPPVARTQTAELPTIQCWLGTTR